MRHQLGAWLGSVMFVLFVAGCGGGGAQVPTIAGVGQDFTAGPVSGRASAAVRPLILNAGAATFFSMSGATFTKVTYIPPKVLSNTRIAFGRTEGDLWTCDQYGTNIARVTQDLVPGTAMIPTWSPDASQIAFSGEKDPVSNFQLYAIGATGYGERSLGAYASVTTSNPPSWSPKNVIAFDYFDNVSGFYQIYTLPSAGGSPVRLSDGTHNDTCPFYYATGTKIAFVRQTGTSIYDIFTMNSDGTNVQQITSGYYFIQVAVSPDGARFAARLLQGTHTQIAVGPLFNGGGATYITSGTDDYFLPSWSPDGRYLVYQERVAATARYQVVVSESNGANAAPILYSSSVDFGSESWSPYPGPRLEIGTGGQFTGTARSGFIFSEVGQTVPSFVVFNAVTPSSVTVTAQPPGSNGTNELFQISGGGGITALAYANDLLRPAVTIIPSQVTSANGVALTMDVNTGLVTIAVPYTKMAVSSIRTAPGAKAFDGVFSAIYDGKGNNLAPNGATHFELSPRTGKLLSFR